MQYHGVVSFTIIVDGNLSNVTQAEIMFMDEIA